jgi:hypothetical protein
MHPVESLYVRIEPVLDVSYPQVDEMNQVLNKIGVPLRVVAVLPLSCLVPRTKNSCECAFVGRHMGIWPCEHESCLCVLRFDYKVRVKVLAFLVASAAVMT